MAMTYYTFKKELIKELQENLKPFIEAKKLPDTTTFRIKKASFPTQNTKKGEDVLIIAYKVNGNRLEARASILFLYGAYFNDDLSMCDFCIDILEQYCEQYADLRNAFKNFI